MALKEESNDFFRLGEGRKNPACSQPSLKGLGHPTQLTQLRKIPLANETFIFKLVFFDVASYLWLTYIATAAPYGTRTMSPAGSHSYQFSAVGSIATGFVDSMCFQRTMALVVEIYSYFDSDKLMYSYVCWYSQNMSWQIEEFLIRSKSFNWIFPFLAYTTAPDNIFMFWTRSFWNWKERKVCICEKPFPECIHK